MPTPIIHARNTRLTFGGKTLDGGTLANYGVKNGATIDLSLRLKGGAGETKESLEQQAEERACPGDRARACIKGVDYPLTPTGREM